MAPSGRLAIGVDAGAIGRGGELCLCLKFWSFSISLAQA